MKGMDTSMVFAIIFAIIVIGLLLAFGLGQVSGIFCFNGVAQVDKSMKDLGNAVDNIYNMAEGNSQMFTVSVPSGDDTASSPVTT